MKRINLFLIFSFFALFQIEQSLARPLNAANLKNCKNIAIVAGTYDPFTNGHEIMGREILKNLEFDCVVYLPTGNPPHKIASPLQTRYEMMEAALKDEPHLFYPDPEDLKLNPKNYVDKLKKFGGKTRKVYAVLGSDLSPQNSMYYINRFRLDPDGYIVTGRGTEEIVIADAFKNRPYHVLPIDETYSSTQARKWFAANDHVYFKQGGLGNEFPEKILRKDVALYIANHGVYLGTDGITTRSPARILKTAFTQGLNGVGLFHPLRNLMVKKNAQAEMTEIVINDVVYPLKKHLGSGLTADAYIFNYQGEDMVIKIANTRVKSGSSIIQDVTIGNWLNFKTDIKVPEVAAIHPKGEWKITKLVRGESLGEYMRRTNGKIEPGIEKQLKEIVASMLNLSSTTNTKLDLSVDNLKIWNNQVYLIDAGPIPADVSHPMNYAAFFTKWKSQSKKPFTKRCSTLWSSLMRLSPLK